jgi:PAS domain S-box-containing protein
MLRERAAMRSRVAQLITARARSFLTELLSTLPTELPEIPAGAAPALGESDYRQVLDAISDMVLVKGPHSRIVWANKAFRDAYGMTNEQLRGIIDAPSSPPDITEKYVQHDAYVFETGKTLDIPEELLKRHNGELRSCHTVKSAIFDAGGSVVMTVGVSRDISERKLLEVELRSAQKLEAIGRLAAGIAHEINTPIQFIADNTTFLRTSFDALLALYASSRALCERALQDRLAAADWSALMRAEDSADLAFVQVEGPKAFAAALKGVYHVTRVVHAMRAYAHPDSSNTQSVDVNQLLDVTLTIAAYQVRDVADVETDFGDFSTVAGYPNALNQVFLNLLINAAHAIADVVNAGGARGRIRVRTYREGDDVVVSISDNGPGIPLEIQSRVFEPFFTTKAVGLGKGYGLMFARAIIVDKHRGRIGFSSIPGEGTTFLVHLPIEPPQH